VACGGVNQPEQDAKESRLSGAVGANQPGDAGRDLDIEVFEGNYLAVVVGEVAYLYN
jgi:hypothetical protein